MSAFLSLLTGSSFFLEAVRLTTEIWTELLASDSWLFSDARKEPTIISFSGGRSFCNSYLQGRDNEPK